MRSAVAAIVGMAIVGAACAARSPASISAPDPTSAPAPTIATEPATEEAFALAGVSHGITCAAIRPDMVGAEVIGVVLVDGRDTPVHRVLGVEPDVVVAVRVPGGGCTEHDPDARSPPWSGG